MLRKLFLFLIIAAIAVNANAQKSKAELQKQQAQLQNEIAELNQELKELRGQKNKPLAELKAVNRKLKAREELVSTINHKISSLKDQVYYTNLDIYRLNNELDTLKKQYAQSLVFAYKNRSNYDYLNFLFSANSFSDAMKRVQYLKSYRQLRETQLSSIKKTQEVLEQKKVEFANGQKEQQLALEDQNKQIVNLQEDRQDVSKTINSLKSQESQITAQISKKNKERKKISNAIAAAIERERQQAIAEAKAKAAAEKKKRDAEIAAAKNNPVNQITTASSGKTVKAVGGDATVGLSSIKRSNRTYSIFEETQEGLEQSLNFESNKGKLPWPVTGKVVTKFGKTRISEHLSESCDGIEIGAAYGSTVRSVANGTVTMVVEIGDAWLVTIQHGKYWTAYSNLSSTSVSKGQEVKANTVIGKSGNNDVGEPITLFMVTNDKGVNYNPESWLK